MQVEELGLFSGGKCNKAVEDKIALELFELFMKYREEFNRIIMSEDIEDLKITTKNFEDIEKDLRDFKYVMLIPKLYAMIETIRRFETTRQSHQYYKENAINYLVVINNIQDSIKPLIFASKKLQSDYDSELMFDSKYEKYANRFKIIYDEELKKVQIMDIVYI